MKRSSECVARAAASRGHPEPLAFVGHSPRDGAGLGAVLPARRAGRDRECPWQGYLSLHRGRRSSGPAFPPTPRRGADLMLGTSWS